MLFGDGEKKWARARRVQASRRSHSTDLRYYWGLLLSLESANFWQLPNFSSSSIPNMSLDPLSIAKEKQP